MTKRCDDRGKAGESVVSRAGSKLPYMGLGWFMPGLAMAPILHVEDEDDDSSETDDPDNLANVEAPRGKHLWCQEDSYGYTKGKVFFQYSILYGISSMTCC